MATIGELMLLWDIRDELKRANDLVEEEVLRRSEKELRESEEEARDKMQKWKNETIEKMKREGYQLFIALKDECSKPIYPHIASVQEAEMLKNNEVKLCVLFQKYEPVWEVLRWTDETREEAQNPSYIRKIEKLLEVSKEADKRVYVIGDGWLV